MLRASQLIGLTFCACSLFDAPDLPVEHRTIPFIDLAYILFIYRSCRFPLFFAFIYPAFIDPSGLIESASHAVF